MDNLKTASETIGIEDDENITKMIFYTTFLVLDRKAIKIIFKSISPDELQVLCVYKFTFSQC